MKLMFNVWSITLFVCSCTCTKNNDGQVKPLWSFNIYDKNDFNTPVEFNSFYEYPIYKNTVVVAGNKNGNATYFNLNINDGTKNWELIHNNHGGEFSIRNPCIKDNYWYFGDGDKFYRIDLITGSKESITIQRNKYLLASGSGKNLNEYFFVLDGYSQHVYFGKNFDVNTYTFIPEVKHQTTRPSPNNNEYFFYYTYIFPFIYKEESCVLLGFDEVNENNPNNTITKFSMYNLNQQKFIYDAVDILHSSNTYQKNQLSIDSLFIGTHSDNEKINPDILFCININNGHLIWKQEVPIGAPRTIKDKVFYTSVTANPKLFIFNKQNGKLLVEQKWDANAASNMIEYNSVIYYIEEGTALRAVDANNGEYLMKIKSPDSQPFNILGSCIGVSNGKIIVDNYKNVYAYPTIK